MAWESDLLASCGRLKEAAESLTIGIGRLASAFSLSLPDDITAAQPAFYRLAHELTRTELPPASLVLHEQIDDLKAGLNSRRELLERRDHASDALTAALSSFAAALGCRAEEGMSNEKRHYYRLANELAKPGPPPVALIFHRAFDELPEPLAQRAELLKQGGEAWEAVETRLQSDTHQATKLSDIETAWVKAAKAYWPLALFRKGAVKKKLKSYMKAEAVADPDVDLPLLREHQDCQDARRKPGRA